MANTKIGRKPKNKDDKSTGKRVKKRMRLEEVEELKFLSHEERIQYLIKNGHLIKDEVFNDVALKKENLDKAALVKKPTAKNNKLISQKGKLKTRNKHIKYMDSILMSELLIKKPPKSNKKTVSRDNNNDNELSDQNNSDSSKNKSNGSEKCTESTQNNGEMIEINIEQDQVISSTETTENGTETVMVEEQQNINKDNNTDVDMIEICIDTSTPIIQAETGQTKVSTKTKKSKEKRKNALLAQRLEKMKEVKLSNGLLIAMEHYECDICQTTYS